ncbi:zinc finger protein 2-like [Nylanderia fulva]|uniref:zinc finger protein 2-like n=1 Tax=Nylanderia fulva TaxID=613905 RepID=UPI0010FAD721|nr:zinc finger protein 2-like [Nylanderia fulva]
MFPRLIVKNIEKLKYTKKPVIYKCTRCGKSYQLETSLRRHQRSECGVEPKHECQICRKKFTYRFMLTHHLASCVLASMLLSHDNSELSWNQQRFDETYKTSTARASRKKSTDGIKYECNRCGKTYKATTSLSRHKRLECGVVPCEVCPICGRRFKHRFVLNAHVVGCERRNSPTMLKKDRYD